MIIVSLLSLSHLYDATFSTNNFLSMYMYLLFQMIYLYAWHMTSQMFLNSKIDYTNFDKHHNSTLLKIFKGTMQC